MLPQIPIPLPLDKPRSAILLLQIPIPLPLDKLRSTILVQAIFHIRSPPVPALAVMLPLVSPTLRPPPTPPVAGLSSLPLLSTLTFLARPRPTTSRP